MCAQMQEYIHNWARNLQSQQGTGVPSFVQTIAQFDGIHIHGLPYPDFTVFVSCMTKIFYEIRVNKGT